MPGVNGTGPRGCGPGTGRGLGSCGINATTSGFGGMGFGRSVGRRGCGNGYGPRRTAFFSSDPHSEAVRAEFTKSALLKRQEALSIELDAVRQAIAKTSSAPSGPEL